MITFVATGSHQYTVRDVLETRTHFLHRQLVILGYDEFLAFRRLPRSIYIFVDIERLSQEVLHGVTQRIEALLTVCPDCRVLNQPDRIGGRLHIMARLHDAGINEFRMLPIATPPETLRYPVFLRRLDDHEGPRSALLTTPQALEKALEALNPGDRAGDHFAITEFVDARNELGLYEKRSYMRVDDRLFPAALDQSTLWVCKGEYRDPGTVPAPEKELAFLRGHADEKALRSAFEVAGIQYGRADYALVGGRPQIFEINTNPWLEPPERVPHDMRSGAEHIVGAWLGALEHLAATSAPPAPWVEVPNATGRVARKASRRHAVRLLLRAMGQLHNETRVMRRLRRVGLL